MERADYLIWVAAGVPLNNGLKNAPGVTIKPGVNGRKIIRIQKGRACFVSDGEVEVLLKKMKNPCVVFGEKEVLQILNVTSGWLVKNHFCCLHCMANSGKILFGQPSKEFLDRWEDIFICEECFHTWNVTS